jgi:C1A family cysteine protease
MSTVRLARTGAIVVALLAVSLGMATAQLMSAPPNPDYQQWLARTGGRATVTADGRTFGYIPAPYKRPIPPAPSYLRPLVGAPPASYDLRTIPGKVPPVRDQSSCGSCWTFATYGSLETFLRPFDTTDFSENNLRSRHGFDNGPCDGGNHWMSTAYLGRWEGPILETPGPLPRICPDLAVVPTASPQ